MSFEVIKAGIADSIQDGGRFGYQHLGINPSGAMDWVAMSVANALVGNDVEEAVIELCFPAASFHFHKSAMIALSGADFSARLNGKAIPLNQPVLVPKGTELKFSKSAQGSFCYLALRGGFELRKWLGSNSTHVKAKVGGVEGRFLKKGDKMKFKKNHSIREIKVLSWGVHVSEFHTGGSSIRCLTGNEFTWLTRKSQTNFCNGTFTISKQSDRMGYRLKGAVLKQNKKQQLLSTAVTFGTIQLLPNGELIILMADHQTTGGYPRVAHVSSADRSKLVQCRPNDEIGFQFISLEEAERFALDQYKSLKQLQVSCRHKLKEFLHDH